MTVKELRKILKTLPPDVKIWSFRILGKNFDLCDEDCRGGGHDRYLEGVSVEKAGFRNHC